MSQPKVSTNFNLYYCSSNIRSLSNPSARISRDVGVVTEMRIVFSGVLFPTKKRSAP